MKLKQILILIILVFILIIWYYNKKEHFNTIFTDNDIQCLDANDNNNCEGITQTEKIVDQYINSHNVHNERIQDTSFYTLNDTTISIKNENLKDTNKFIKSFGFYIKINSNIEQFMKLNLAHAYTETWNREQDPKHFCAFYNANDDSKCVQCKPHKILGRDGKCFDPMKACSKKERCGCPDSFVAFSTDLPNEDRNLLGAGNRSCQSEDYSIDDYNREREVLFTKKFNSISIEYNNETYDLILNENDIKCTNGSDGCTFFWIFVNLKETNNGNELEIILNNTTKTLIPTDFNIINEINILPINGKIGNILGFDKYQTIKNICNEFNCFKNDPNTECNFNIPNINSDNPLPTDQAGVPPTAINCIEKCIKNTNTNNCNIKQCQKKCLGCIGNDGQLINVIERSNFCPWYDNMRIKPSAPDPVKLRGFSIEKQINNKIIPIITLEWRKPYHNMSKIINYIIEIKDLLYKNGTQIKTIPQENEDIFQIELNNLKPQTTYEICVRAVGEIRNEYDDPSVNELIDNVIGKKSNILTITTGGENKKILKQAYDYLDSDYSTLYNNHQCNEKVNSDHILNNIDHNDINIYKSLQNL